jgi:multicomponent K+:H+ antiporter subunit D
MNTWIQHLPILPIVIPMAAGAAMLMLNDSQRRTRIGLAAFSMLLQLAVAVTLLRLTAQTSAGPWPHGIGVYLLGGWSAPFGIVVVADRLSAIMLTLNAVLGLAVLVYSNARWDRAGAHFHPLFQFLAMGINGAFLTGDIFNLFVFFEVLLAASYGLMLHGSGRARVGAGLHYITVNLVASLLMLIAIALIYGVAGTLNMADLAVRAGLLNGPDRQLFETGAAILGIAFLIKAAAWPLNFWLPATYANSCAPVAAVFAIMTKVGIYALLRLGSLLLPTQAPAAFSGAWMFPIGLGTLAFGTFGLLTTQQTPRLAAYCIIVSSGTLLAALGMPGVALTGPALYYLISSVLAVGAFFLLTEMVERTQMFGASVLATSQEAFSIDDAQLSDHPDDIAGATIPAAMAFLGLAFILCTLLITGLPPLSGFVAKFALLSSILDMPGAPAPSVQAWLLLAGILISGMAGVIALARTGIRLFWSSEDVTVPRLSIREAAPVTMLLGACVALTLWAGPATTYLASTAKSLNDPTTYIQAVIAQQPGPAGGASGVTP